MTTDQPTTCKWKAGDKALIETWGTTGPTGQWIEATITRISHMGRYYHLRDRLGFESIRMSHELRRPTPTEPATCHPVRRMVGLHVRVEPPLHERDLHGWAGTFCQFLHDHRSQANVVTIQRDEQDQCSECGKEWTPYRASDPPVDGVEYACVHCRIPIGPTEPTR